MNDLKNDSIKGVIGQHRPTSEISRKEAKVEENKLDYQIERDRRKNKILKIIDLGALVFVYIIVIFLTLVTSLAIPCHIFNAAEFPWLSFLNCGFVKTILTQTVTGAIVTVLVASYISWLFIDKKAKSP